MLPIDILEEIFYFDPNLKLYRVIQGVDRERARSILKKVYPTAERAYKDNKRDLAKYMLLNNFKIGNPNNIGCIAIKREDYLMIDIIIDYGANVDVLGECAAYEMNQDMMDLMLEYGANDTKMFRIYFMQAEGYPERGIRRLI